MNITTAIASISLLFATGAALADEGVSRASVIAELRQAQAAGQLDQSEAALGRAVTAGNASTLTREQVKAEVLQARAAGLLDHSEATDAVTWVAPTGRTPNVTARPLQAKAGAVSNQQ